MSRHEDERYWCVGRISSWDTDSLANTKRESLRKFWGWDKDDPEFKNQTDDDMERSLGLNQFVCKVRIIEA